VGDLAAAVADTHAILFHAAGGRGLGSKAAAMFEKCERQQAVIYVPAIVMWEVSLLARASRVNLRRTVRGFFDDLFSNPSYQPFDMTVEQVCIGDELRFSRDPFDVLICAAARALDLPLLTCDADIRGAGVVRVIW
jgi:PIN domain nuclease of toxin-antitoxin system